MSGGRAVGRVAKWAPTCGRAVRGRAGSSRVPWLAVTAALAVGVWLLLGGDAAACPNCKDGVNTSDPDGLNLARGYFYSILLMLAMPFTLAGSFGCYVWREMRRLRREQASQSAVADATAAPPTEAVLP
jgi:hypothetical protein